MKNIEEFAEIVGEREPTGYEWGYDTHIQIMKEDLPESFIDKYRKKVKDIITYDHNEELYNAPVCIMSIDKDDYNYDHTITLYKNEYNKFINDNSFRDLLLAFHKQYKQLAINKMKKKIKQYEEMED